MEVKAQERGSVNGITTGCSQSPVKPALAEPGVGDACGVAPSGSLSLPAPPAAFTNQAIGPRWALRTLP
jgi:hypothetical protein